MALDRRQAIRLWSMLFAISSVAACKSWKGNNLGAGHECATDERSRCAAGLYCDVPRNGREEHDGDSYFVRGVCATLKSEGRQCWEGYECVSQRCERPMTGVVTMNGGMMPTMDSTPASTPGVCARP